MKLSRNLSAIVLTALTMHSAFVHAADITQGKKRAAVCFACHGENGISKIDGTPHLAGQNREYLEKALHAYREGQLRQDPTMTAMAKPLSDNDITNIAVYFSLQVKNNGSLSMAETIAIYERVKPAGTVALNNSEASATPAAARSGDSVFNSACIACHGTGVAGAPKMGDKALWKPRIAQGQDALYRHALAGLNAMPPKGTCGNCSEDEIKHAVDYMVNQSK